jgi:hypothetical protein
MKTTRLNKDEVVNSTYVKICINKTHMGPVNEGKVAHAKASMLSAAANKVRVTAGFTIKVNTDNDKDSSRTNSQNRSYRILGLGDDSPMATAEYAVLLMQAWDSIFRDEGTPDYVKKLAETLEARAMAYNKLGINPASGDKPNLTADQRVVYNSIVGPTGFDYYEYHLAFKLAGQKKFVRSKTYRSLEPLEFKLVMGKISSKVETLKGMITITTRQTN